LGTIAVAMGLGDLVIGLVYMLGLLKELGVSHQALFCDAIDIERSVAKSATDA
jgi:hypothetical protein